MKKFVLALFIPLLFAGCASVPMESAQQSQLAKQFSPPENGKAALYIYRSGSFGGALKKYVWVDGECIGASAPNVFFYKEVRGDAKHDISTESEFSPNHLSVYTESGKNYFIHQYMKMGVFVGGANLEVVDEAKGRADVEQLELAIKGNCGQ